MLKSASSQGSMLTPSFLPWNTHGTHTHTHSCYLLFILFCWLCLFNKGRRTLSYLERISARSPAMNVSMSFFMSKSRREESKKKEERELVKKPLKRRHLWACRVMEAKRKQAMNMQNHQGHQQLPFHGLRVSTDQFTMLRLVASHSDVRIGRSAFI